MKLLIVLAGSILLLGCHSAEQTPPKPVVAVKAAQAERRQLKITLRAPATVFAKQQAAIAARLTAPVRSLKVRKGDTVKAGQILAELEDRDLLAQRAEAQAAVADAQATLEKLTAGTLPADVERARGQVAAAEAALRQAEKIHARRRQLYEQGAIPGRDLLVSQTELAQAKANYEVAQKSLELLWNQSRERDIRIAQSRLEQAQARLAYIQAQLEFTRLRSPFAGTIIEQFLFPGDMARPDAPVFTVADLSVAVARAQVPEAEAAAVRPGQECRFASVDGATSPPGRITVVNKAVDASRRTVEVWCEACNPGTRLHVGAFGEVEIVTAVHPQAVVVPAAAVQFVEGTDQGIVLVVEGRHVAHRRQVRARRTPDGRAHVRQGLNGGEWVITEGGYELPDGTEVRIQEEQR